MYCIKPTMTCQKLDTFFHTNYVYFITLYVKYQLLPSCLHKKLLFEIGPGLKEKIQKFKGGTIVSVNHVARGTIQSLSCSSDSSTHVTYLHLAYWLFTRSCKNLVSLSSCTRLSLIVIELEDDNKFLQQACNKCV